MIFARSVVRILNDLPKTTANEEIPRQLIRSSGAVGASYIEANDSLGKRDFVMRLRIARKEAKESRYWLRLLESSEAVDGTRAELVEESAELLKVLSAMIQKAE